MDTRCANPAYQLDVDEMVLEYLVHTAIKSHLDNYGPSSESSHGHGKLSSETPTTLLHVFDDFLSLFKINHAAYAFPKETLFQIQLLEFVALFTRHADTCPSFTFAPGSHSIKTGRNGSPDVPVGLPTEAAPHAQQPDRAQQSPSQQQKQQPACPHFTEPEDRLVLGEWRNYSQQRPWIPRMTNSPATAAGMLLATGSTNEPTLHACAAALTADFSVASIHTATSPTAMTELLQRFMALSADASSEWLRNLGEINERWMDLAAAFMAQTMIAEHSSEGEAERVPRVGAPGSMPLLPSTAQCHDNSTSSAYSPLPLSPPSASSSCSLALCWGYTGAEIGEDDARTAHHRSGRMTGTSAITSAHGQDEERMNNSALGEAGEEHMGDLQPRDAPLRITATNHTTTRLFRGSNGDEIPLWTLKRRQALQLFQRPASLAIVTASPVIAMPVTTATATPGPQSPDFTLLKTAAPPRLSAATATDWRPAHLQSLRARFPAAAFNARVMAFAAELFALNSSPPILAQIEAGGLLGLSPDEFDDFVRCAGLKL